MEYFYFFFLGFQARSFGDVILLSGLTVNQTVLHASTGVQAHCPVGLQSRTVSIYDFTAEFDVAGSNMLRSLCFSFTAGQTHMVRAVFDSYFESQDGTLNFLMNIRNMEVGTIAIVL